MVTLEFYGCSKIICVVYNFVISLFPQKENACIPLTLPIMAGESSSIIADNSAATRAPTTFTSPNGTVLTFQSAGNHLSSWLQTIGHTPDYSMEDVLPQGYVPPPLSKKAAKKAAQGDANVYAGPPPGSMRVCTVNLPFYGPIRSTPWANKALAKQSASFEAVKELHKHGEVDDNFHATHLRPKKKRNTKGTKSECHDTWEIKKAVIRDQLPRPTGGAGHGQYDYQTTPEFWSTCPPFDPRSLHASILQLSPAGEGKYDHPECRMMCMLTSRPLPVFKKSGQVEVRMAVGEQPPLCATMRVINGGKMGTFYSGKLDQALVFTEKLMRAELQKVFRTDLRKVKWLLLPLRREYVPPTKEELVTGKSASLKLDDISWKEVDAVTDGALTLPFTFDDYHTLMREIVDSLATAPSEMSRRSYILDVRQDLHPLSPHPDFPDKTICDILKEGNVTLPQLTEPSQPILEVSPVNLAKTGSYISTAAMAAVERPRQFLVPEFEHRHCIPASVFRTCTVIPYFIFHLESMLIAEEMSAKEFNSILDPELALQAITAAEGLNVPRWTYERLEILGDTLLKFITTLHFYLLGGGAHSEDDMNKVWQDRHMLISNRTLTANAVKQGLVKYVRNKKFKVKEWTPRDWELDLPPGQFTPKKAMPTSFDGPESRTLGDKVSMEILLTQCD